MSFSNVEGSKLPTSLPQTQNNTTEFSLYRPIQSLQNICTRIYSLVSSLFNKFYALFYSKPKDSESTLKNKVKSNSSPKRQFRATKISADSQPVNNDKINKTSHPNAAISQLKQGAHSSTSVSSSSFSPEPPPISPSLENEEKYEFHEKKGKENTHTVIDPSLKAIKHSINNICDHALQNVIPGYQNEIHSIIAFKVRQFFNPFPFDQTFLHRIDDVVSSQYVDEILKSSSKLLLNSSVNFVDLISGRFLFAIENMDRKNLCNNITMILNNHLKGILPLIKQERIAKLKEKNNNPTYFPTDFERERAAKEKTLKDRTESANALSESLKHREEIKLRCQSIAEKLMKITFAQEAIEGDGSILHHPIMSLIHESLTETLIDKIEMISLEQSHIDEIMSKKILPEVYDTTLDAFLELIIEYHRPKLIPFIIDYQNKQDAIQENSNNENNELIKQLEDSKGALFDLLFDLISSHYRVEDALEIESLCKKIWKMIPRFIRLKPKSRPQSIESSYKEAHSKESSEIRMNPNLSTSSSSTSLPKQEMVSKSPLEDQHKRESENKHQSEDIKGGRAENKYKKRENPQMKMRLEPENDSDNEVESKIEKDMDLSFDDNVLATEFIKIIKNIVFEMGECDRPDIEDVWTNGLRKKSVGLIIHSVFKLGESNIKKKLLDQVNQVCNHPEKIYRQMNALVQPMLNQRMIEKTIHNVIKSKLQSYSRGMEREEKRSKETENKSRNSRNIVREETDRKGNESVKSIYSENTDSVLLRRSGLASVSEQAASESLLDGSTSARSSHRAVHGMSSERGVLGTCSNRETSVTSSESNMASSHSKLSRAAAPIKSSSLPPELQLNKQFKNLASLINDFIYFQTSSEINISVNSNIESIFKFLPGFVKKWVVKPSANAFSWGMERSVNGLISTAATDEDVMNLMTKIYNGLVSHHRENQLLIADIALASVESLQKAI